MREGMEVDVKPAGQRQTTIRRRATIVTVPALANRGVAVIEYADTGGRGTVRFGRIVKRP